MTWGTTLFEAQALTWNMSIPDVAKSLGGGIFLQDPGGTLAVPLVQRYGRLVFCSSASTLTSKLIVLVDSQSYFSRNCSLASCHWIGVAFGWGLNTFAMLAATTVISAYVLDCFPQHAALASSWLNFWRVTGKALTRHH